ncbi:hypothetical protein BS78_03G165400 [Paspalum vaginatum]|nr:hypothetical protein BS78_03G165400 [Paspalum vaginatum]
MSSRRLLPSRPRARPRSASSAAVALESPNPSSLADSCWACGAAEQQRAERGAETRDGGLVHVRRRAPPGPRRLLAAPAPLAPSRVTTRKRRAEAGELLVAQKHGPASVTGRRREMEDAVSVREAFAGAAAPEGGRRDFYGVFDGHGCSHIADACRD